MHGRYKHYASGAGGSSHHPPHLLAINRAGAPTRLGSQAGNGHTAKAAEHVRKGAGSAKSADVCLYKAEDLTSPEARPWGELAAS